MNVDRVQLEGTPDEIIALVKQLPGDGGIS